MRYHTDDSGYITGWGMQEVTPGGEPEHPWPEMLPIGALYDQRGKPIYKLDGGRIVKAPQSATAEELEAERRTAVRLAIAAEYSIETEIALIAERIEQGPTERWESYRKRVEEIKRG